MLSAFLALSCPGARCPLVPILLLLPQHMQMTAKLASTRVSFITWPRHTCAGFRFISPPRYSSLNNRQGRCTRLSQSGSQRSPEGAICQTTAPEVYELLRAALLQDSCCIDRTQTKPGRRLCLTLSCLVECPDGLLEPCLGLASIEWT